MIEELARKPISEDTVIISIAGGVPIERYKPLGEKLPVVRALPNPPSQIGWGIAALTFNPRVTEAQRNGVLEIFTSLGEYVILKEAIYNATRRAEELGASE